MTSSIGKITETVNGLHITCPNGGSLDLSDTEELRGSRSSRQRSTRGRAQPFFIGVAGGTASGKTTVCDKIMQRLHDQCVVMLSQDSFYRGLTEEELADVGSYNFDHPNSIDNDAVVKCLDDLKNMRAVDVPIYDFTLHERSAEVRRVEPADVVIVEGILVLHIEEIRSLLNMKIFVDTDDDLRLARRIQRDVALRGRDIAGVIEQYTKFVKPAFDTFVAPSRKHADIIIPWGRMENEVAIDLITEHIKMKLRQPELQRLYHNLEVIPSNFQIRGMHTLIRDRTTSKADFVFYADRLLRLVVEHGLGHLPFTEKCVVTGTKHPYIGVDFAKKLCGVSIIRSGESMENALRACCKGIKIGKILVHRVGDHVMEKELIYEKLPADIAERHVLVMDPILATGNSAVRAIQVVLSKGVDEGKILFLSLIAAPEGIHMVCRKFPRVKVITSEIDEGIDESTFQVVPGVGEFGDLYFCD
ncbi:putative uracil phosphoribosyl transferase [Coccomyxa subellipsoidea C-169]|uniref:Uridine kinase n=1 Tax=Coccomyxa subellipsoidea (strain C-169) TaxID=574566 RepID=I0YLI2_COCSC|nr:putative uracil phosphoribosyl transferase [Coccomyxa subellipsoidea C-169]EIE19251.1 putative uracil phosphoribosyl transferase [Coccomyxa subellipsoidea C-169]|eukprot:XP_005643795.1 putative uracil phosphoribosyl transferase [Coccomyxa subellipsoidea C-169]